MPKFRAESKHGSDNLKRMVLLELPYVLNSTVSRAWESMIGAPFETFTV